MVGSTSSWASLVVGSHKLLGCSVPSQLRRLQMVSQRTTCCFLTARKSLLLNRNYRGHQQLDECSKHLCALSHSQILSSKHVNSQRITQLSLSTSANQQSPDDGGGLGKEIYYGMFEKTLKGVKLFSLANSFLILSATPVLCYTCADKLASHSYISAFALSCSLFVGVLIPVFLHTMSRRYVTNVFYNAHTDTFTLQYYSLFMRKKYVAFTSDDVMLPLSAGYSTHLIKNRPYFIMKQYFYSDQMHAKMLGC